MDRKAVKFEVFLDGLVSLWALDAQRNPIPVIENIRFQARTIGLTRAAAANQAGYTAEKMIRIPRRMLPSRALYAVIDGQQYKIQQAQEITDTIPRCLQLTLSQPDILLQFDQEEVGAGGRY